VQRCIENGVGTRNNTVTVKKSDFEVFQALDKDSENPNDNQLSKFSFPFSRNGYINDHLKVVSLMYKLSRTLHR